MDNDAGDQAERERRSLMTALTREMEDAAASLDYERARVLRDRLNLLRGGAAIAEANSADTAGLTRQQPGSMGLGTSQQRLTPPKGWRQPPKPDPMTRGKGRRRTGKRRP
ncbi:MAG: excinuclease subunit [Sphingomonas bacterium]|nr:excinuclease subunit [Sphingomonas bacterium]